MTPGSIPQAQESLEAIFFLKRIFSIRKHGVEWGNGDYKYLIDLSGSKYATMEIKTNQIKLRENSNNDH